MKQIVGFIFLGFLAASVLSTGLASTGHAQAPAEKQKLQWPGGQNIEEFKEWRRNIPDYDKRLYDRIKGINKRVIRVTNLVIASFFLLLILNFIFLSLIYRRLIAKVASTNSSKQIAGTSEAGVSHSEMISETPNGKK